MNNTKRICIVGIGSQTELALLNMQIRHGLGDNTVEIVSGFADEVVSSMNGIKDEVIRDLDRSLSLLTPAVFELSPVESGKGYLKPNEKFYHRFTNKRKNHKR